MVGGLLLLRLFLLSPPSTLTLHSIKIKILQHFHATSPTDSSRTAVLPVDSRTVMHLHGGAGAGPNFGKVDEAPSASNSRKSDSVGSPLRRLERGEGWRMHHLGRLPDHEMLRPSTNEWSETGLRVGHEMGVEVVYQVGEGVREKGRKGKGKDEGEVKKMVLKRGLELFSVSRVASSRVESGASAEFADARTRSPDTVLRYCRLAHPAPLFGHRRLDPRIRTELRVLLPNLGVRLPASPHMPLLRSS